MATLKIKVQDSKFISHNSVEVEIFSREFIMGNGWECTIKEDGYISCMDMTLGRKFIIKNGWVRISKGSRIVKLYKLEEENINGIIGLPDDYTEGRAFFRTIEFQEFLDEYGISAVRNQPVDSIYNIEKDVDGDEITYLDEIQTDGNIEIISNIISEEKNFVFERSKIRITNATWVIKTSTKLGKVKSRILYTEDNPRELLRLPKSFRSL